MLNTLNIITILLSCLALILAIRTLKFNVEILQQLYNNSIQPDKHACKLQIYRMLSIAKESYNIPNIIYFLRQNNTDIRSTDQQITSYIYEMLSEGTIIGYDDGTYLANTKSTWLNKWLRF